MSPGHCSSGALKFTTDQRHCRLRHNVCFALLRVHELRSRRQLPYVWDHIEEYQVHPVVGSSGRAHFPQGLQLRVGFAHGWTGREEEGVAFDLGFLFQACLVGNGPAGRARILDHGGTCGNTCGRPGSCNALLSFYAVLDFEKRVATGGVLGRVVDVVAREEVDPFEKSKPIVDVAVDALKLGQLIAIRLVRRKVKHCRR